MQTLAITRLIAIALFVGGGLFAFSIDKDGAGYMLVGAAAAAFPSGVHLKPNEKSALGLENKLP